MVVVRERDQAGIALERHAATLAAQGSAENSRRSSLWSLSLRERRGEGIE